MDTLHFIAIRWTLFIVETLVACAPFLLFKKRRGYFYVRLGIGFALLAGAVTGIAFGTKAIMETSNYDQTVQTFTAFGGYFIALTSVIGFEIFIFKEKMTSMLSSLVQGFATRSAAFCSYVLLATLLGNQWNFLNIAGMGNIVNLFPYLGMYALTYFLIIFSTRKVIFRSNNTLTKGLFLVYSIVVVALLAIISIGEFYSENDKILYIFLLLSEITCYIVLFVSDYLLRKNDELTTENELVSRLLEEQARQFKFSKANAEDLRMKAHDLKHQVRILREGGEEAERLLSSLEEDIDDFESTIYLDNQTLNIVLREKWGYCKKHRIRMSYSGDPSAFPSMSSVDLFTLTGNILDNAIEASMKLSDKSRRVISASLYHKNGLSTFRCDNFYEGEIRVEDGKYITDKGDDLNHGIGIQSIKRIVKKYGGSLDIKTENNIFVIKVTIPD